MEDLKIWRVSGSREASELETTRKMETEDLLESILTENPDMLEYGLELVGRQTDTGDGPLDLLGVDSEGRLVVFELKRGVLHRNAVAQAIDYASHLAAMDLDSLYQHISERSGNLGIQKIEDFKRWYNDNYSDPDHDPDSLTPPRIVLVGLGVDDTTERMVNYLAGGGLDVSLLTFHGFKQDDDTLLARNVEVRVSDTPPPPPPPIRFIELARTSGALPLVEAVTGMFSSQPGSRFTMSHATTRRHFNLSYSWHLGDWKPKKAATLFIEIDQGTVNIGFHPVAVTLATSAEFEKLKNQGLEFKKAEGQAYFRIGPIDYELKHQLRSIEEWKDREENLTALVRKVCEGYDALRKESLGE